MERRQTACIFKKKFQEICAMSFAHCQSFTWFSETFIPGLGCEIEVDILHLMLITPGNVADVILYH